MSTSIPKGLKPWRQHLLEVRSLLQKRRINLYQITRHLVAIFDDAEWRAENAIRDDGVAYDQINQDFAELEFYFEDLHKVYQKWPQQADWRERLISDMIEELRPKRAPQEGPARKLWRISKAEWQALQQDRDHWRARAEFLERRVKELETAIGELDRVPEAA